MIRANIKSPFWLQLVLGILAIGLGTAMGLGVAVLDSPIYVVAGMTGAVGALICVINPKIGLYILVAITYLRLSDVLVNFYGAPSIAKPFIALMIGIVLLRWWYYEAPPKGTLKITLLVMAYGLAILLSIFQASDFDAILTALDDFWKNGVIAILVVMLLTDIKDLRNVVWGLIVIGIFMGSISIWQYLTGTFDNQYWGYGIARVQNIAGSSSGYRIAGPIGDPNFYAQIMLVITPLSFIRFLEEKKPLLKTIALAGTLITLLTVVYTFSRGAFLAILIMTACLLYFHPPGPREFMISIAALLLIFPYIPEEFKDRVLTLDAIFTGNQNAIEGEVSFRGRNSEYIAAWMMFSDNPILGVGINNYNANYQTYSRQIGLDPRAEARSAHSLYLEILAELGIIGFGVFGLIIIAVLRSIVRAWRQLKKIGDTYNAELVLSIGIGILGYLTSAIFVHDAYPRYFWLLIGIGLSATEVARRVITNSTAYPSPEEAE